MKNHKQQGFKFVLSALLLTLATSFAQAQTVKPLTMPGKTALYQKVLAIPGSQLYPGMDTPVEQASDVEPFSVFYVYDR